MVGRRDDDVALERVLEQPCVLLERGLEERLGGHEHHDELRRRRELVPVPLAGEVVDVPPEVAGVGGEPLGPRRRRRASGSPRGTRGTRPWRRRRCSCRRPAGRPCRAAARRRRCGPAAARRSRPARACPAASTTRRSCSSPHRPRTLDDRSAVTRSAVSPRSSSDGLAHRAHLLGERRLPGEPRPLRRPQLGAHLGERAVQRLDEAADRLLALGDLDRVGLLGRPQPLVGQREELLVVLRERVRGDGPEPVGQPLAVGLQHPDAVLVRPALGDELGVGAGGGHAGRAERLGRRAGTRAASRRAHRPARRRRGRRAGRGRRRAPCPEPGRRHRHGPPHAPSTHATGNHRHPPAPTAP